MPTTRMTADRAGTNKEIDQQRTSKAQTSVPNIDGENRAGPPASKENASKKKAKEPERSETAPLN
jgi:hypothetical protein